MKTVRKIAKSAKSEKELLTRVERSYPQLKGREGLAHIAARLYKPSK